VLMVNSAGHEYDSGGEFGLHEPVPAGAECEIADGYCKASLTANGSRWPSIVERIAPFLVPADPGLRARWGKEDVTPPPAPATEEQKTAELVKDGLPPAVAELVAAGAVEPPKKRGPGRPPKVR
jgi:hypothetical protein